MMQHKRAREAERREAWALLTLVLSPGNENVARQDLVAALRDVCEIVKLQEGLLELYERVLVQAEAAP